MKEEEELSQDKKLKKQGDRDHFVVFLQVYFNK